MDCIGKDPDARKDWRQEEKGKTDGWMASLSWWTWAWASSKSWWWTGKPGMLQSMGSQRVGHYWVTELIFWINCSYFTFLPILLFITAHRCENIPYLFLYRGSAFTYNLEILTLLSYRPTVKGPLTRVLWWFGNEYGNNQAKLPSSPWYNNQREIVTE